MTASPATTYTSNEIVPIIHRYLWLIALMFIGTTLVNYLVTEYFTHAQRHDAELINLAGRQRMLVSRVAFLGTQTDAQSREELAESLNTLRIEFSELMSRQKEFLHEADMHALYLSGNNPIAPRMPEYLDAVVQKDTQKVAVLYRTLLPDINNAVNLFSKHANHRANVLYQIESLGLVVEVFITILMITSIHRRLLSRVHQAIAEQSLATVQLEQQKSQIRAIFDASSVPKALYGNGRILYINPAFTHTFGYTLADIQSINAWWSKAYPDLSYRNWVREEWSNRLVQAQRGAAFEPLEVSITCKNGNICMIQMEAVSLQNDFQYAEWVTFFDITALRHATDRLQTLLENASDGIHVLDTNGNVVEFSHAFARMLGYSLEETACLNVSDWDVMIPKDQLISTIAEILTKPTTFETKHRGKDGSVFDAEINAKAIELGGKTYLYASSRNISERKNMEAELHRREQYQRVLLDNFPFFVWLKDTDSRLLTANLHYARVAKVNNTKDLEGKTDFDFFPHDLAEKYVADDRTVMASRQPKHVQEKYVDETGERYWMETWKAPLVIDGEIVGTVGYSKDITEQKLAEQEIERLKEQYEVLFTDSPDAYLVVALEDGCILDCNRALETMMRGTRKDIIGKSVIDISPPNQPNGSRSDEAGFEHIMRAHNEGYTCFEWVHRRLDGSDFWVEVTVSRSPFHGQDALLGAWRDITERKAMEKQLAESRERAELAIEATKIGIYEWNVKTGAVHWDEQMFSIYGVLPTAEGQVTYQDWRNAVLAHEIEQQEEIIKEMLLTKKDRECRQFSIQRHNDGGIRVIESVDNLRLDNSGEPEWVVGTNWDITERKRAEQQTLKLLNELKRSNAELNSFTYIASHDLKSPLRGIDQLATWITEDLGDNLDADTRTHLKLMRSRINRMEMLLDDLLTYSRVGRINQAPEMVNVRELVENIFDLTAHSSTMQLRLADDLPVFITEKVPLELVFRNLINNSIKHHHKPDGVITITCQLLNNYYEFIVQDDGPGIAPEHQQRVFEMFQTLKPRDEVEGSGIGLAIVKKSITNIGGTITLESDGCHGCTFRFTWPSNFTHQELLNVY